MNKTKSLDRQSHATAAYMQLVQIVSDQIAKGVLRPGDQLPTEAQFCAQYQVSPMTVRRAVNILVEKGLVSTTHGRGTFVKPLNISQAAFRLEELKEQWTPSGEVAVQLLEATILSADERVSRKLAIPLGQRAIYIRRLVLHDDIPTIYHREYLIYDPKRPVVEAQVQITSLEGLLQGQSGEGLRRGDLSIEAVNLKDEEAQVLQIPTGTAAFYLEHIFYDFNEHPVSWGGFICRADRFKFTTWVGADAVR